MSEHRAFRGVWIPAELWLDTSLSLQEKVMLVEIDSLQHPERGCYKSNSKLADFFQLSRNRVSEIISSLKSKGYITVENVREGKRIVERRIYMVAPTGGRETEQGWSENRANPSRDSDRGWSENREERGSGVRGSERGVQEDKPSRPSDDVRAVFDHWRDTMGKTRSKLDAKRYGLITKAIASYGVDDVKKAITGCSRSAFHMGDNPKRKRYDGLDLILRNADKIESFAEMADAPAESRPQPRHNNLPPATANGLSQRAGGGFTL